MTRRLTIGQMENYLSTVASDPFANSHATDRARADKAERDAAGKQAAAQAQARMAATKQAADRPANADLGYSWPKRFFDPGS
jgi:hypothetical protein